MHQSDALSRRSAADEAPQHTKTRNQDPMHRNAMPRLGARLSLPDGARNDATRTPCTRTPGYSPRRPGDPRPAPRENPAANPMHQKAVLLFRRADRPASAAREFRKQDPMHQDAAQPRPRRAHQPRAVRHSATKTPYTMRGSRRLTHPAIGISGRTSSTGQRDAGETARRAPGGVISILRRHPVPHRRPRLRMTPPPGPTISPSAHRACCPTA